MSVQSQFTGIHPKLKYIYNKSIFKSKKIKKCDELFYFLFWILETFIS